MRRSLGPVALVLSALVLAGCATFKTSLAPPLDLEDYRAFRVAAKPGTRVARAKRYLERHPKGAFADEVRAAYEEEEPRYFQEAQGSREGLRRYLADLPDGPHAEAALSLLVAYDSSMKDAELRDLARRVRYQDAKLEAASVQRRAVGEAILGALGVLVEDETYGVRRADASPKLRALMLGSLRGGTEPPRTWGAVPERREDDFFFVLPTRPERESRLLTLEVALVEEDGVITGARLAGGEMLVRWAEADQIVRLDPSLAEDRTEAQVYTMQRVEGALERRFPAGSCRDLRSGEELYHRACSGWEVIVLPGGGAGDKDAIILRSAHAKKTRLFEMPAPPAAAPPNPSR